MDPDPSSRYRKPIRLPDYDYSQGGFYFVTACTSGRACLFGDVTEGEMEMSPLGVLADRCWRAIPEHFPHVALDVHVVMPNHVHGILVFLEDGAGDRRFARPGAGTGTLGAVVGSFNAAVSRLARAEGLVAGGLWQARFWDHIIRNDRSLEQLRRYIDGNPWRWLDDDEHPARGR